MKHKRVYQKIRLYKAHDLDLISFLDSHHMDFRKAVYCSLTAFAKGELFVIKIPPRIPNPGPLRWKYEFNLSLNPETDRAVIDMIDGITNGYKNNFIKNLLRMYLCTPISAEFLKDPSRISLFEEKFRMFKRGRRIADAAKVKRARTGRAAKHRKTGWRIFLRRGKYQFPRWQQSRNRVPERQIRKNHGRNRRKGQRKRNTGRNRRKQQKKRNTG